MEITALRLMDDEDATIGAFYINGIGRCFTLEDEEREIKVKGETRVPEGRYRVTLRTEGGFNARYSKKFGSFHKGMLWVRDVPNFEYVLIHIGNTDEDTAGCLLVGTTVKKGFLADSTTAYKDIYPEIADALLNGEDVFITYKDIIKEKVV